MTSDNIETVQDLINFLLQFDPQKQVFIYDTEWGTENCIQHIDVESDAVIMYT